MGLMSSLRGYHRRLTADATLKREVAPLKFCWQETLIGIDEARPESYPAALGASLLAMYDHWLGSPDDAAEVAMAFAKDFADAETVREYMRVGWKFMLVEPVAPRPPTMNLDETWSRVMSVVQSIAGDNPQFRANMTIVMHLAMFHIGPNSPLESTCEFAHLVAESLMAASRRILDAESPLLL